MNAVVPISQPWHKTQSSTSPAEPPTTIQPSEQTGILSKPASFHLALPQKAKDTTAGFLGGVAQILVGQPLDLVKVLLQTNQFKTPQEAIIHTFRNEGLAAFYKGSTGPLIGVGCTSAITFNLTFETRRQIMKHYPNQKDLTIGQFYLAGTAAGVLTSFITCPIEQVRILLQAQNPAHKVYEGTWDAFKKIYAASGFRGVYRGLTMTLLRDGHAHGVWFGTFELLMHKRCEWTGISRADIPTWEVLLYGGLAGDTLWVSTYPADIVKTVYQNDKLGKAAKYSSGLDVARKIYATEGFRGFWKGVGPALVRAFPVNAAVFATVEACMRIMG